MRSAGPSSLKLPPLSELNARCVECSPDRYKRPLVRDMVFALGWKPYGDQFELVLPAVSLSSATVSVLFLCLHCRACARSPLTLKRLFDALPRATAGSITISAYGADLLGCRAGLNNELHIRTGQLSVLTLPAAN